MTHDSSATHVRARHTDLRLQGLPGVRSREDLREHLVVHGCHDQRENLRIYEEWFASAPRYLFKAVNSAYGISGRILCDVGCSYGMNLPYCAQGSYGIEIVEHQARFARSIGLQCYTRDIGRDDVSDLPGADVVWCSAVLEHVDSPHEVLRKLHSLLNEGGLVVIYVPTVPAFPALGRLPRLGAYFRGHTAADHVNFFTPETLRHSCERAGFRTLRLSVFYPRPLGFLNLLPFARRLIDGCVYVGTKIPGWEYPAKATRRADHGGGHLARASAAAGDSATTARGS